jgi:hypothetical protein
MNFVDFIRTAEGWGLTDVMLPFLLIFTIMFAILQKTKVLGEGKKNYNIAVALVFALLVVIPHVTNSYPDGTDIVEMLNKALPSVSVVIIAIVMLLIFIGIFGRQEQWKGPVAGWVAILCFAIILVIFGAAAGWWLNWSWFTGLFGESTIALIVILLIFGIIIAFITGDEKKDKSGVSAMNKFSEGIRDFFGGGGSK